MESNQNKEAKVIEDEEAEWVCCICYQGDWDTIPLRKLIKANSCFCIKLFLFCQNELSTQMC